MLDVFIATHELVDDPRRCGRPARRRDPLRGGGITALLRCGNELGAQRRELLGLNAKEFVQLDTP